MRLLVTGGCGFVGSNFIRYILNHYDPEFITNVDALTYASSLSTTADFLERFGDRYEFVRADIADVDAMEQLFSAHTYFAVVNFAAESQLAPRVKSSRHFVHSNVVGTNVLLEAARSHGVKRFLQVSTDEVYGSAEEEEFTEASALCPSSPYSASKAAADLLALSCHRTFGQDVIITRSSNNYGPYQHPEKLMPVAIISALRGEKVPIYGDGRQQRDWIHVEDHCNALFAVLMNGRAGEIYNVCSGEQWANLDLVLRILAELNAPPTLVQRVADHRPSHDRRYRLSGRKLREELGWKPLHSLGADLPQTIRWYQENQSWWTAALQAHTSGC
jgi:dTDP-glucose 4,6-dehydratase